jgi:Xaa-Pro aminopeptidase
LLISNLTNIRYLTGLELSAGFLLITQRKYRLFVDQRYREAAEGIALPAATIHDHEDLKNMLLRCRECGFEANDVTVDRLGRWKRIFKNTKFVRTKGVIEEFRRSKDARELRSFRRAQHITHEMLRRVPAVLRKGITERDVAWKLTSWAHELGADGLAFDPIVAFGSHTSSPHHHPTGRKLRKGHIVQIDVGARYRGYCADQSAVFFTRSPTALQKRVLAAVEQAKERATKACRAGVTNRELDRIACAVLKKHGFEDYIAHALGHGVGLEIHEGISLSERAPKKKLLKNEIVTIEPGLYIPGKFGIRLEDEVVIRLRPAYAGLRTDSALRGV